MDPNLPWETGGVGEILVSGDVSTGLDYTALKYIVWRVRERKGLIVDSSRTVVVAAEKQRTMKK
jgi:hypothetical protein